jgi:trk system potassium uptake protein TrkH
MRAGVIQRVIGRLLGFTVVALVVPLAVSVGGGESIWYAWLIPAAIAALLGFGVSNLDAAKTAPVDSLRRREGFLSVTLGWTVLVFFTALAYHITGEFEGFAGAFFESMSGYTTTGATVFSDIEALPDSILLMRSWSHWIGGMGIIVLSVAILPELAVGGMQLFAAESSGIDADKLAPRIAQTARRLWVLYFGITLAEMVMLLFGGMSVFDAINHAMATIATGGFSTKNASIAGFDSLYIEMVIVAFMFLSGMSFTLQYRALIQRQPQRMFASPEVRLYTLFTVGAMFLIAGDLYLKDTYDTIGDSLRYSSFQTVSIITTTGFCTADFDAWSDSCRFILVVLMLIGGCAGSTAGGFKVIRLVVVLKHATYQLRKLIRPRLVQTIQIGGREIPHETTEAVLGYYLLYFAALSIGALALTGLGMDLVSGTTASISAMNSIGPGLGTVGAVQNFAGVPDTGMYLLSFGMLLGRLEIYTVLVLFSSHFWRRA